MRSIDLPYVGRPPEESVDGAPREPYGGFDRDEERWPLAPIRPPARLGRDHVVDPCRRSVPDERGDGRDLGRGLERRRRKDDDRQLRETVDRAEEPVRGFRTPSTSSRRTGLGASSMRGG
jgi:hypothetical protein